MEAQIGSQSLNLCVGGTGTSTGTTEKKGVDWNLNDYRWNGDLFLARRTNPSPSICSQRQLFNPQERNSDAVGNQSSEPEKRRRISPLSEEESADQNGEGAGSERNNEAANLGHHLICQVDGCDFDLSNQKDYHKRHKICPRHSKASTVSIRGEIKRFCQQCSKFHDLEEFDEGKRSCRRRLDRHNGRRRKKNNKNTTDNNALALNGDQANTIITALLKIITNLESARSGPQSDQQNLISELLQRVGNSQNAPGSNLNSSKPPSSSHARDVAPTRDFDLNDEYFEEENEYLENESPFQASSSDTQSRTGKVVFKLFGKEPSNTPPNLRPEIMTWLSNCPSEMESYIRPGCIVLTLYLRLSHSQWQELGNNLAYWMKRLVRVSDENFWGTSWVYATLQDQVVFLHDGRIILEGALIPKDPCEFKISNITPIAIPFSSNITFSLKGFNLSKSNARLFCAYDGEYLVQDAVRDLVEERTGTVEDGLECLSFSCSVPASTGRGFIEIEEYDHSGFFFPIIVTDEPMCIEIRELETELDLDSTPPQNKSLDFLHELGWLLRKSQQIESNSPSFSKTRYKTLISFAVNREWCSVLKKLLDVLFTGDVQLDGRTGVAEEFVLGESLLLEAIKMKSKPLVSFLLRYKVRNGDLIDKYLFVPDMRDEIFGTPLHLAATMDHAEGILDALTNDPTMIGIRAWTNSHGPSGTNQTPKECAEERGKKSYIKLVQDKIDSISNKSTHAAHFDIEKGYHPNCRLGACRPMKRSNRFLQQRPAIMILLSVAAVCVCVGIVLQTPPFVKYTKPPFSWDSLQRGPT